MTQIFLEKEDMRMIQDPWGNTQMYQFFDILSL